MDLFSDKLVDGAQVVIFFKWLICELAGIFLCPITSKNSSILYKHIPVVA